MIYDGKKTHRLLGALFAAYCLLMLWLLFIRNRSGIWDGGKDFWQYISAEYNLAPFHMIRGYWRVLLRGYGVPGWRQAFINFFGNIGMLIPFGFFLPAVFKRLRKLWVTLGTVLGTMVALETVQLLTLSGHFDVDDLILNVFGAAIGYGVFRLMGTIRGCK